MPPRRAAGRRPDSADAERLKSYRSKRDFRRTPEPDASADAPAGGGERELPRFVIHEHSATSMHWDLRLERDGALASWAVPKGLPEEPKDNRLAVHTEDHPLRYLDFAGDIPRGSYGAGTISIWDSGTYECLKWEPRKIEVALHGERISGRYALFPIEQGDTPRNWMVHRMDPPQDAGRESMPTRLVPMLARPAELPPAQEQRWAYEIKWDGVRAIAYSTPGTLRLSSRNLIDVTDRYPELARLNRALSSHSAILDGEIVAFDASGRPSFEALQQRMQIGSPAQARRLASANPVTYVIFDLLWLDGHSLMALPYSERRERLVTLHLRGDRWQTPEHIVGDGPALLAASAEQGLEGVVAKRLDSIYEPGVRSRGWLKIKSVRRQEFVIGGWLPGAGRRSERIGALLLGLHDHDHKLRYVGRVGSGLSERELERLGALLAELRRGDSPFEAGPNPPRAAVFAEPALVAEVAFAEWTRAGQLRQPSYLGLRDDKAAAEVAREDARSAGEASRVAAAGALEIREQSAKSAFASVDGRELKLSNLDKVLYPREGTRKREVIDYYAAIAPALLPHLQGRALTVTRWPDGVEGKSFFQKQAPAHRPEWVRTASLATERKRIDYVLADDLATLVWLANLAAIELHVPLALASEPERPTAVVFDLDPGEPAGVLECARVALQLQGTFENLGLESLVKTSGQKGLQLYVPLNRAGVTFEHTKAFAKAVAELLAASEPDLVVSSMTRAKRTGRVLIDWSQNDRNKTTVCAYSLRATAAPSASAPLRWEEVRDVLRTRDPSRLAFPAREVLARVQEHGDLFAPLLSRVQALPAF